MNYAEVYFRLTSENDSDRYVERHHILPKCLGGTDAPSNIVLLVPRKHFIAHWLLTKMYKNTPNASKLNQAFGCMQRGRVFTGWRYDRIKRALSEAKKGRPNGRKGIRPSEESIAKMAATLKARYASGEIVSAVKGKPGSRLGVKVSEETKAKHRLWHANNVHPAKGKVNKRKGLALDQRNLAKYVIGNREAAKRKLSPVYYSRRMRAIDKAEIQKWLYVNICEGTVAHKQDKKMVGRFTRTKPKTEIGIVGEKWRIADLIWTVAHGEFPSGYIIHLDGDRTNFCVFNLEQISLDNPK